MKIFLIVKSYLIKYKFHLILFIILNLSAWIISLIVPYLSGIYIDKLIEETSLEFIYIFTLIFLAINFIQIIISYFSNIVTTKLKTNVAFDLNFNIIEHIKKVPLLSVKDINSIYLTQKINSDANSVSEFVIDNCINIFIQSSTVIISIYILFDINKYISIILLLLIPLYIVIYLLFKNPMYKYTYDVREKQSVFFSKLNEQISNLKFIKSNSLFDVLGFQLHKNYKILFNSVLRLTKTNYIFSSLGSLVNIIANVILVFWGGYEIINGNLTIGKFTIINTYFMLLLNSANYYLNIFQLYQDTLVSYNRLIEIKNIQIEQNGIEMLGEIKKIELHNINFSFNEEKLILKNYNKTFHKGKIYTITGENGAGKSTLVNLIIGLFNGYYTGDIYYNNINIKNLDLYEIRRRLIGITEQEPILLNNSLIDNLRCGISNVNEKDMKKWFTALNMDNFILTLPQGLQSSIEENATNISGGEKQKICHIRTLLKNPDLIIFDEPTAALDKDSSLKFQEILKEIKTNKIIVIVTHSDELIDIADEIICFK